MQFVRISKNNFAVVIRNLVSFDAKMLQAAKTGLARGLLYTVGVAQRQFLSGPRPDKLDVRTTRLRNSISSSVEMVSDRGIVGRIGTNVSYGAFHEFGFHGTQQVKAHTRVTQQLNALGVEIDNRRILKAKDGTVIGFKESRKKASGRQKNGAVGFQNVQAHTRNIHYAGRPFVRPALEKCAPIILREIAEEIDAIK